MKAYQPSNTSHPSTVIWDINSFITFFLFFCLHLDKISQLEMPLIEFSVVKFSLKMAPIGEQFRLDLVRDRTVKVSIVFRLIFSTCTKPLSFPNFVILEGYNGEKKRSNNCK